MVTKSFENFRNRMNKRTAHKLLRSEKALYIDKDYQLYRLTKLVDEGNLNAKAFIKTLPKKEQKEAEIIRSKIEEGRKHDVKLKFNMDTRCYDVIIDGQKTGYVRTIDYDIRDLKKYPDRRKALEKVKGENAHSATKIANMEPFSYDGSLKGTGIGMRVLDEIEKIKKGTEGNHIFFMETEDKKHSIGLVSSMGYRKFGNNLFMKYVPLRKAVESQKAWEETKRKLARAENEEEKQVAYKEFREKDAKIWNRS